MLPALSLSASGSPPASDSEGGTLSPAVPRLVGLEYLANLVHHPGDRGFLQLAMLAQFEQQGVTPPGLVALYEQALADGPGGNESEEEEEEEEEEIEWEPYPQEIYRDLRPICDVDHDGIPDFATNDWGYQWRRQGDSIYWNYELVSEIRVISGAAGRELWTYHNLGFMLLPSPFAQAAFGEYYHAPFRAGDPGPPPGIAPPAPMMNTYPDVNDDGACDIMVLGFEYRGLIPLLGRLNPIGWVDGELAMLNGTTGAPLWSLPLHQELDEVLVGCPPSCSPPYAEEYRITGFPTGLLAYVSPSGPKFVWKTTDMDYHWDTGSGETWLIRENITVADARTGQFYWTRQITHLDLVSTWITGVADLAGDEEPEVVLDDAITRGNPQWFPFRLHALRGELGGSGETLWGPTDYYRGTREGQVPDATGEDGREIPIWTYGQIIGDVTLDGRPEVVGLYLTRGGDRSTTNGLYRTHFVPLDGATGRLLWDGADVKYQGWGFAADLNADPANPQPFIGIGTIDLPPLTLSEVPPAGARFPPKDVRMAVLSAGNGEQEWSYREAFPLNTYITYDMALRQYQTQLAPADYNNDGRRDLLTPARHIGASGPAQKLLSTSTHDYLILDAASGETLHRLEAPGPMGQVVACPGQAEGQLTIVGGHARRIDLVRIEVANETIVWRQPIHNNPTPQAQVAGTELLFVGGPKCGDFGNRTLFAVNLGENSLRRGYEIIPLHGLYSAPDLVWVGPKLRGDPPIYPILDIFEPLQAEEPDLVDRLTLPVASAATGISLGVGAFFLYQRRRGGAP